MLEILSTSQCDRLRRNILAALKTDGLTYRVYNSKHKNLRIFVLNKESVVVLDKRNHKNTHVHTTPASFIHKKWKP